MQHEALHTIQEAAGILRLHPKTILRFIKENRIPARKIGRSWMMTGLDLDAFAGTGSSTPVSLTVQETPPAYGSVYQAESVSSPDTSFASATLVARNQTLESAQRLSTTLMALANSKHPEDGEALVDISWHPASRTCTIRLQGSLKVVATLLAAAANLEN